MPVKKFKLFPHGLIVFLVLVVAAEIAVLFLMPEKGSVELVSEVSRESLEFVDKNKFMAYLDEISFWEKEKIYDFYKSRYLTAAKLIIRLVSKPEAPFYRQIDSDKNDWYATGLNFNGRTVTIEVFDKSTDKKMASLLICTAIWRATHNEGVGDWPGLMKGIRQNSSCVNLIKVTKK